MQWKALWQGLLGLLLLAVAMPAAARALGDPRLQWSGFGTIGVLYHDAEGLEYRRTIGQPEGARDGELDPAIDTRLGLQLSMAWTPQFETLVQAVSRKTVDHGWRPDISRAFLRYTPTADLMLRAGRMGLELLPNANSVEIGYTYLMARPSGEILGDFPNDYFNGADLTLIRPIGEDSARLRVYGGSLDGSYVLAPDIEGDFSGDRIVGANLDYLPGAWTLRLGIGRVTAEKQPEVDALALALRNSGAPQANELAGDFEDDDRHTDFYAAVVSYDGDPWQGSALAVHTHAGLPYGQEGNRYALQLGYRQGTLTPYAGFAWSRSLNRVKPTGLEDDPAAAPLNDAALAVQQATQMNQRSYTLGLRYDFAPRMDLKLQADHVRFDDSFLHSDRRSARAGTADMTVFSLTFDFIF